MTLRVRQALFLLAVAVVVIGLMARTGETPTAASRPATPSPAVAPDPMPTADPAGPQRAITAYLTAFLDGDLPYDQWRRETLSHATGNLSADLTALDRSQVPDAAVMRVKVDATTPGYAEGRAWLSTGDVVHATTILIGGEWRVDEVAAE